MEWISVDEKLPEKEIKLILYSENKYGTVQGYNTFTPDGIRWYDMFGNSAGRVTHWMPWPEPPEQ